MTIQPRCRRDTGEGCFAKSTLIRTPNGMFPIERLELGDLVVTQDGRAAKIAKVHTALATELVRLSFSDGGSIVCTPWHRVFDIRGNLAKAEELATGTVVRSHDCSIAMIVRVQKVANGQPHEVHNLSLERDISFYANGKLVEAPRASRILNGHALLASAG